MENDIRERINKLKKAADLETDNDVIIGIFNFKKLRGEIGRTSITDYIEKTKGSFSQAFSGKRPFKPEDYLAIESVLNTSMAYIIEGKGEIPDSFKPKGIRYAAFSDTIGNYEELIREDVLNGSDEYNKMLIDYMIQYKSKNGFVYFAEHGLLPIGSRGETTFDPKCLRNSSVSNVELLKTLCGILPTNLLIKYFDGFVPNKEIEFYGTQNTSFTDDVISEAIKNEGLRKELSTTKVINLDSCNRTVRRADGNSLGDGRFVNYGLTAMLKYALTHDVDELIRNELLENAFKVNEESLDFASTYKEDELKIDKNGYITNKSELLRFGSIAMSCEPTVTLSSGSTELLEKLNRQIHNFHEYISSHSKLSAFKNEIYAERKDNAAYYDFFELMNSKGISTIPLYEKEYVKEKDLFKVENSEQSRIANGADETLRELIKAVRAIDEVSWSVLNGKTYYMVNPSFYMLHGKVNYIMPMDIRISGKYSNLIDLINDYYLWSLYAPNSAVKVRNFVSLAKLYGIERKDVDEFLEEFKAISEEEAKTISGTSDSEKEFALKKLENKAFIEIYKDDIVKEF